MAVVTRPPGERAVARPSWVRRQDSQHEGIVAGIMLALVIVGIVVFLFWGQMLRIVASSQLFHAPSAPTDRPAEGAAPPGPAVVVSLDQPVIPSSAPPLPAESAGPVTQSGGLVTPAQEVSAPDQLTVLDPSAAGASIIADAPPGDASAAGADVGVNSPHMTEAEAAAEAAAAHDAAETARAAEEARAADEARAATVAQAAATPAPTAAPAATATRPALTPTPAATPRVAATTPANAPASAAASGKRARVVRTGGRGVVMYSAPRQGARLPAGFPEGSVVSVLSANGEWTQVQANGQTGWVKSEFLAPAE